MRAQDSAPTTVHLLAGIYRGIADGYRIDLFLEPDQAHSSARLTVDFFQIHGARATHAGWCLVRKASLVVGTRRALIKGVGRFNFSAAAPLLRVVITHDYARAEVRFLSTTLIPGARYRCSQVQAWPAADETVPQTVNRLWVHAN